MHSYKRGQSTAKQGHLANKNSENTLPDHQSNLSHGYSLIWYRGVSGYVKLGGQVVMWWATPNSAGPTIQPKTGWAIAIAHPGYPLLMWYIKD